IALNTTIGFVTEWKATKALTALRSQTRAHAHVVRDGEEHRIPAARLVPGDVVFLEAGERVAADGRIFESATLKIDEATLTGESVSVEKSPSPLDALEAPLGDRRNMAYLGTVVTEGRGRI